MTHSIISMKKGWEIKRLDDACDVEYGTRVVQKRDGGTIYPVYGGGGATFFMDTFNRENRLVVSRFAMSEQCTRFVEGKFFLNDSGLTIKPKNEDEILQEFLNWQILCLNDTIYSLARGTAQKNLDVPAFRNIQIAYPKSLPEQQRIVSILDECFAAIDKAKANAEQNLKNAKELFESFLQGVFENGNWEEKVLGDLCLLITKGSSPKWQGIKYVDEPGILFVTSENVGEGKMLLETRKYVEEKFNQKDKKSILKNGDVLTNIVGASIGRTAIYDIDDIANINQAVCILRCNPQLINNVFLMNLLNSPFLKKILHDNEVNTARANLSLGFFNKLNVPCPSLEVQQTIVRQLDALRAETQKLEAVYQQKIADLEELKKSILQKAFSGEFTSLASASVYATKVIPLQKVEGISPTDLQAGITALALQKHIEKEQQHSFHHVKAEKIVHLSEYILNIDLNRSPVKDAAGPNDFPRAKKVESRARKAGFYSVYKNGEFYDYKQGNSFNKVIQKAQNSLGEKAVTLSQIIDMLIPMTTQQAEIIATVFGAWNNLILSGNQITDEDIVAEARENWHKEKLKIPRDKFFKALEWMKQREILIPKGNGKIVKVK